MVKVTQEVIDGLGMVVAHDGKRLFSLNTAMRKSDVKTVLKSMKQRG